MERLDGGHNFDRDAAPDIPRACSSRPSASWPSIGAWMELPIMSASASSPWTTVWGSRSGRPRCTKFEGPRCGGPGRARTKRGHRARGLPRVSRLVTLDTKASHLLPRRRSSHICRCAHRSGYGRQSVIRGLRRLRRSGRGRILDRRLAHRALSCGETSEGLRGGGRNPHGDIGSIRRERRPHQIEAAPRQKRPEGSHNCPISSGSSGSLGA